MLRDCIRTAAGRPARPMRALAVARAGRLPVTLADGAPEDRTSALPYSGDAAYPRCR